MELIITTREQLSEIIRKEFSVLLAGVSQPQEVRMSRKSVAKYLDVSVKTVDNIVKNHPEIMAKHFEGKKAYYLQHEADKWKAWKGISN